MDEDHRELLRRLFVAVAEMAETAHEAAIAGLSLVKTSSAARTLGSSVE